MLKNKIKDSKSKSLIVRKFKQAFIWALALVSFVFLSDVLGTATWRESAPSRANTNVLLTNSTPVLIVGMLELIACLMIWAYIYYGFGPLFQWFKTRHSERR